MITVISATNRPGSYTYKISETYVRLLENGGLHAKFFSLQDLPSDLHPHSTICNSLPVESFTNYFSYTFNVCSFEFLN